MWLANYVTNKTFLPNLIGLLYDTCFVTKAYN